MHTWISAWYSHKASVGGILWSSDISLQHDEFMVSLINRSLPRSVACALSTPCYETTFLSLMLPCFRICITVCIQEMGLCHSTRRYDIGTSSYQTQHQVHTCLEVQHSHADKQTEAFDCIHDILFLPKVVQSTISLACSRHSLCQPSILFSFVYNTVDLAFSLMFDMYVSRHGMATIKHDVCMQYIPLSEIRTPFLCMFPCEQNPSMTCRHCIRPMFPKPL